MSTPTQEADTDTRATSSVAQTTRRATSETAYHHGETTIERLDGRGSRCLHKHDHQHNVINAAQPSSTHRRRFDIDRRRRRCRQQGAGAEFVQLMSAARPRRHAFATPAPALDHAYLCKQRGAHGGALRESVVRTTQRHERLTEADAAAAGRGSRRSDEASCSASAAV